MSKPNPPLPNPGSDPILEGLKRLYNTVVEEPIPPDFIDLLQKIDAARLNTKPETGEG